MTLPHAIVCVRIGSRSPTQSEILGEVQRLHYQYGDVYDPLRRLETLECQAQVGAVSGFPNINQLVGLVHSTDGRNGVTFVAVNLLAGLVTVISFPEESPRAIVPLDGQAGSHLGNLKNVVSPRAPAITKQLGPHDEIRLLLAGASRHRRGLFLAGSPGWNSSTNSRYRPDVAQSKNDGSLAATLNDANTVFQLFHSLTADDYLAGLVAGFLIREKRPLQRMLQMLPFDPNAHGSPDVLSPLIPEHGLITFDTKLFGSVVNKGRVTIIGGPGIGFGETIGERLHNGTECQNRVGDFAAIYYSGHGSSEGNMQIEKELAFSPEELCDLSQHTGVPYLLILDMCYASRFGKRYRDLLNERKWHGMVMCANDESTSGGLSFESTRLGTVRRPYWRFNVLDSDWSKGRGVYTTALTLAIHQLRECENIAGSKANMTVREFNDYVLRSICEGLTSRYGVPLLKPAIYHADERNAA